MSSYRVLIVDDELTIRSGLASCIAWHDEGFELAGEAIHGQDALDRFADEQIDILITDIKMPLLNGLELTRCWKEINPKIKVILVSSYSDFEYAREAVQLGVVADYLLKPTMEPEDLLRILHRCKQELEQAERSASPKLQQLELDLKKLLNGGKMNEGSLPEWWHGPMVLSVWELDCSHQDALECLLQVEQMKEALYAAMPKLVAFIKGERRIVAVTAAACMEQSLEELDQLRQRLLSEQQLATTVGVSPLILSIEHVMSSYKSAASALEKSFFRGLQQSYLGKPLSTESHLSSNDRITDWSELRIQFSQQLSVSNQEACQRILEQYNTQWNSAAYAKSAVISEAKRLLTMIWLRMTPLKAEEAMVEIIPKLQTLETIKTLPTLVAYMNDSFQLIWKEPRIVALPEDSKGSHVIQLALSYIQENFRKELSLKEVADYVYMSKNYFSEQFKHYTGLNFIDFVISLRIHHAKKLLENATLRIQEVGAQSGFQSPKYFFRLFKREVGCTPAEYRQKKLKALH